MNALAFTHEAGAPKDDSNACGSPFKTPRKSATAQDDGVHAAQASSYLPKSAFTLANTLRNICGVSTRVLVL